jgi:hypothetical protein
MRRWQISQRPSVLTPSSRATSGIERPDRTSLTASALNSSEYLVLLLTTWTTFPWAHRPTSRCPPPRGTLSHVRGEDVVGVAVEVLAGAVERMVGELRLRD